MKKTVVFPILYLCMIMVTAATTAAEDSRAVAELNPAVEPHFLFSKNKPLTKSDQKSLQKAQGWIDADQYPFRDGQQVKFLYGAGQTTIICAPLKLCTIELEAGEKIVQEGIHLGDTARWMISPAVGGEDRTYLIIKPVEVGLETTLVIVTDRRMYHMRLVSRREDYMPAVAFHYPKQIKAQWQNYYEQETIKRKKQTIPQTGENIADLDFDYSISGCNKCAWRPQRVYNNGQQTIISMDEAMSEEEAPVLLVVSRQGENLVNYRVRDNRYIVDTVFNEAKMILGVGRKQEQVTIKRTGGKTAKTEATR